MSNYSFILPVDEDIPISSFYGDRNDPLKNIPSIHYGLDFACPEGSNVYAVADGEVIWIGNSNSYGNAIVIEHDGGYLTLSAHLNKINVQSGDYVYQGQQIGLSGSTGKRVKGPHLHFETIDGNEKYNGKLVKDIIKNNNGLLGEDGYNHTGVIGSIGRYDMYTGKLLHNPSNKEDNKHVNRAVKEKDMCYIENHIMCKINSNFYPKYTRETLPTKYYIWRTQGDDKVRSSHAELEGTIHSVNENIFPGEEYNCRCWAEEITDEDFDK